MNKKLKILTLMTLLPFVVNAWETDNYTTRVELKRQSPEILKENMYRLNNKSNEMIESAIDHFNRNGKSCVKDQKKSMPRILSQVKNNMGNGFISGALEDWAADSNESGINIPKLDRDIYSAMLYDPDPSFNLGGVITGTDKLGHFVDQGFDLYSKYIDSNKNIDKALLYSDYLEESYGPYGLSASGIKSYGDLSANMAGFRFYQNLLGGTNPHISCDKKSGEYKLTSPMNWAEYVDDSFDEALNCSLFFSNPAPLTSKKLRQFNALNIKKEMNNKGRTLQKNLKKLYDKEYSLEKNADLELNNFCPVENKKCDTLIKKNCASYFVSPMCYKSVISSKKFSCKAPKIERPVTTHTYASYSYPDTSYLGNKKIKLKTTQKSKKRSFRKVVEE